MAQPASWSWRSLSALLAGYRAARAGRAGEDHAGADFELLQLRARVEEEGP